MRPNYKYYRLNYQIPSATFRLLDDQGKQIGIVTKEEALRMAQSESKDLVEISSSAKPPVVKLIDFKKFKYLEAKKEREAKKKVKNVGVKEVRLSPFIGQHDLEVRLNQGREFLEEGNQLKINLKFSGREFAHKEFGFAVINKFIAALSDISKVDRPPRFEGKMLVAMLVFQKKTKNEEKQS